MRIRIKLILPIRKPQPPIRIKRLLTQLRQKLLKHPPSINPALRLPKPIHKRDLNRQPQIRLPELIEPVLRYVSATDGGPGSFVEVLTTVDATGGHVVDYEVAEDGDADGEGDGEGDVVEDAEAGGEVGYVPFGEGAGAAGLGELLVFVPGKERGLS